MLQSSGREDPPCRGKVEVISQEEFETHKSRAAVTSGQDCDDELQFSLDEPEEGSSEASNHSGQPLVKLEPDAPKSRFYPVPAEGRNLYSDEGGTY